MFLVWYRYRCKARYVASIGGLQILRPNPKKNMVYGTLMPELTVTSPHLMSTPEPSPTHLQWATLCQSRPNPVPRVDFIPQPGTLDLASVEI
jgi:hypothetical protein